MSLKVVNSHQLHKLVLNKKPLDTKFSDIDHSKLFIHDHLTQLYHTPLYDLLNADQRLRYNQMFAHRTTEQLMTLEATFIKKVLNKAVTTNTINSNEELVFCMKEMIEEEAVHYEMFRFLNHKTEPSLYTRNDMFFARHTPVENFLLNTLTASPGILPFLVWVILILEEFSTYISKEMISKNHAKDLEKNFVSAHREHLKDETRHVHICANILTTVCNNASVTQRYFNARLLNYFMRVYITPKHGGLKVINKLIEEFPELSQHKNKLNTSIYQSRYKQPIWHALFTPSAMPVSHMMFDKFSDFELTTIRNEL